MLLLLFASIALASWESTGSENGCTFYRGTPEGEVVPIRAICDWPIAPQVLHELLANNGDHDLYFSALVESTVRSNLAGVDRVFQLHRASGISDREIMLDMANVSIEKGRRYTWTKAADQSGLSGDNVEIALDTGKWEVTSTDSGVHLVYELRYLAGGSVPGFLVRWFQGSGVRELIGELRKYAASR